MTEELPEGAAVMLRMFVEREHGYLSSLGVKLDGIEGGEATLTIPFDESLTNPTDPPTVDAGVASTLIDAAGELALRTTMDDPVNDDLATIGVEASFLRDAVGDLVATAEVARAGETVGVATVTVESETPDGERAEVATGRSTHRLYR